MKCWIFFINGGSVKAIILTCLSLPLLGAVWKIDSVHSSATFRVRHLVIATVSGKMSGIQGQVVIDDKDPSKSRVNATLDPATIWTDNKKRDDHLRAADFLDVAKYPKITFKSTSVKKVSDGKLAVTGNLTIKNVTKKVTLQVDGPSEAVFARSKNHKGVTAKVVINRQHFGVSYMKKLNTGGLVVGNDIDITIDLELVDK